MTVARRFGVVVAALLLTGVALGVGWALLAPGRQVFALPQGVFSVGNADDHAFDAQAMFGLFSFGAGVVLAAGLWRLRELRGPVLAAICGVGGVLAGLLAMGVGTLVAGWRFDSPPAPGSFATFAPSLWLGAAELWSVPLPFVLVFALPSGALAVVAFLALASRTPDLGRGDGQR